MRISAEKGHRSRRLLKFACVSPDRSQEITMLLGAWSGGDGEALGKLMAITYPEIRRIAKQHLARRPQQTLESAAVANEAYVRLVRGRGIECENRLKFLALCAQIIRRVIAEYARSQRYAKRGGGAVRLPLDEEAVGLNPCCAEVMALDEALESLSRHDARKAALVEHHCFGGLTIDESAKILGISPETAKRDWKFAKAWLQARLTADVSPARDHSL
jgi:RNA polymerase sigma-70 factor, ECF subfamily